METNVNGGGNSAAPGSDLGILYGLNVPFAQVREFHINFEHPAPTKPQPQPVERAQVRGQWIREECDELADAITMVDQADAYIDIIYFALGGLVEMGIMPQALFDIVHNANMGKMHIDPETGERRLIKDPVTGKTLKPENWQRDFAPEERLRREVTRQCFGSPLAR